MTVLRAFSIARYQNSDHITDPENLFLFISVALFTLIFPTLLFYWFDNRQLAGVNVWVKPLKFHLSFLLYAATLMVLIRWIEKRVRLSVWFRGYCYCVAFCIGYEIVWIMGAAAMGTVSHFNTSSPVMEAAYATAGVAAVILTSAALVIGILVARNPNTGLPKSVHFSVYSSCVLMCVLTLLTAGYMSSQPGHLVGGNAVDIEAIPMLGWATDSGDLRVAHFFASHIFHVVPLLTLLLYCAFGVNHRTPSVVMMLGYIAFVVYTFFEAVSGHPFLYFLLG